MGSGAGWGSETMTGAAWNRPDAEIASIADLFCAADGRRGLLGFTICSGAILYTHYWGIYLLTSAVIVLRFWIESLGFHFVKHT